MSLSLRDQLLKAGLVNQKQAKQVGKDKQKQQRLVHKGQAEADDTQARLAQEAMAEKVKRDQELNRQQQEKAEAKARTAQVKQLIETSRLPKLTTEDYYNFVDDKKVKRLSLLSGGERSLTAVALLVAIFKARPSPFYVMDEVEAALDDVNLGRLLEIFRELRDDSQLIVITHQKRTMEIADALYGVTMRGDGVTTVISQRLTEESVSA